MNFYNTVAVALQVVRTPDDVEPRDFYLFHRRYQLPEQFQDQGCELLYSSLPNWVGRYNFNGWLSRTEVWRVFRCHKS